jgi:hypothetical protein
VAQSLAFTGGLVRRFPWVRDRMIADDKFLFKVVAEVLIDSGDLVGDWGVRSGAGAKPLAEQ